MTTDNNTLAGMGAEVGYEGDEAMEPARVSGIFSLIFGLLSVVAFMGIPLLLLPVLAIVLGMIALRRCEGKPPLGTGAAKIGLVLAVGFGAFGAAIPWMKVSTLGAQARQYSLAYLNLIARGDDMLASELKKRYPNRLPPSMSLEDFYSSDPKRQSQIDSFRMMPINADIRRIGPDFAWQLDQPIRVDYVFGREQVEVVWRGPSEQERIQFFMEFQTDSEGVGQWHVETIQVYRDRVVAEKVL
jgi:hypothetical protein